jgi:hypothetical protein
MAGVDRDRAQEAGPQDARGHDQTELGRQICEEKYSYWLQPYWRVD